MKLFFRHLGTGHPVVILHGLFGISDNWVTFGRRLAEQYAVFIPDLRNHGQSPHSPVFDYAALREDLNEFTEDLELDNIILIGHSLGGKTAMDFALHYPEKISKLIIVDISMRKYSGDRDHQDLINAMMAVDFSIVSGRSDIERQLAQTVDSVKLRQFLLKNAYWRDKTTLGWRINLKAIDENIHRIFEGIASGGPFIKPAMFIRGERSDYILDEDIALIKQNFPGAAIKTISGASHWVHADAPEEFYEVVKIFLSSTARF